MAGAMVTNVFVLGESPALPFGYLVGAALVAWFRRPPTAADTQD